MGAFLLFPPSPLAFPPSRLPAASTMSRRLDQELEQKPKGISWRLDIGCLYLHAEPAVYRIPASNSASPFVVSRCPRVAIRRGEEGSR
jgi:hypothetical protein